MLSQPETDFSVATENDTDEDNAKLKGCQRKSISLPSETVEYLKSWMMSPEHVAHPYPTEQEKLLIMKETGIELKQLTNWFVNNRKRYWKPRVEAKLQQKAREQLGGLSSSDSVSSVVVLDSEPKHSLHTSQAQVLAPFITMNIFHAVGVQPLQIPGNTFVFPSSQVASRIRETAENSSTPLVSSPCLVSDVSVSCSDSNVSEDDSNKDDTNEADISVWDNFDHATGMITRSESVDVHILRPLIGNIPSVDDVVVTYNAPLSRILRSYRNTMMEFTFPRNISMDRQKIQLYRSNEVNRIKKHFLKVFTAENSVSLAESFSPCSESSKRKCLELECVSDLIILQKRLRGNETPISWHHACESAEHFRDHSLPSLEEAARLFGYAQ